MAIKVTLKLPESLIEHAKQLGAATQRDVDAVLSDALEMLWLTLEENPTFDTYLPVSQLSDNDVLALANAKMDEVQNQRLGDLQRQGKATGLTFAERYELLA